ncbi:MAG: acyl-ACP--UDP-N-acetylglucosamine O-acyltransferase [Gammaproteobacteria bacterium]|nr:acyl-ACP--UDP-N-acetylglucosamine O-acyltransferase [Gammaproteobacteria bacterium]MDH3467999.1 acyl-ACP--UDP-N-acetylglucosamine O-acyltransferase [Gammaproteobacteria bacterium]
MIDPRAVVDPDAKLANDVTVEAFSIIGGDVEIGEGTWIGPHVVVRGHTRIGQRNKIFQFCSVGDAPQHLGYKGEPTRLEIGDDNTIREFCTLNRGTAEGGGITRIGNNNFLMAYVHVAHDCIVGDRTIFANCASLAGHVAVQDNAILGGFTLVHQYCRVGAHSITGIGSVCLKDIPPFIIAAGNTATPHGVNVKGLRRRGFADNVIVLLRRAYRTVYRSQLDLQSAIAAVDATQPPVAEVQLFSDFLKNSQRGIIR